MTNFHGDIEISVFAETLSDHYLMSPNDLHRGKGEWGGFTLRARGMLAALLTMGRGWKTSRNAIDTLAPELGRDAVAAVLKELRARRVLYTRRVNTNGGKFTWEWRVFMRPQPAGFDPFGVSAGRTIDGFSGDGQTKPVDNSPTIDGFSVNGADQGKEGVSAGRTIDGLAVDGKSVVKNRRTSTPEGTSKKDLKPPPSLTVRNDDVRACEAEPGGGDFDQDEDWTDRDQRGAELLGDLLASAGPASGVDDDPWASSADEGFVDEPTPQEIADEVVTRLPELVEDLPELSVVARRRVAAAVVSALGAGADLDGVLAELARPLPWDEVQDWGRFLAGRVGGAASRVTPRVSRPAWCGDCDERTRMVMVEVTLPDGYVDERPARCGACSGAVAVAA